MSVVSEVCGGLTFVRAVNVSMVTASSTKQRLDRKPKYTSYEPSVLNDMQFKRGGRVTSELRGSVVTMGTDD